MLPILTNQNKPCHARSLLPCFFSDMMTTDFRSNGYSTNRLICDCAGEPTHAITTLLSNSFVVTANHMEGMCSLSVDYPRERHFGHMNGSYPIPFGCVRRGSRSKNNLRHITHKEGFVWGML